MVPAVGIGNFPRAMMAMTPSEGDCAQGFLQKGSQALAAAYGNEKQAGGRKSRRVAFDVRRSLSLQRL